MNRMTQDMNSDKTQYSSELRTMLHEALALAMQGEFSAHIQDPYFFTKKAYPMETEIDKLPLYPHTLPEVLLNWAGLDTAINRCMEDILVLDLETTGLGRGETLAFMIGLGYYEHGSFVVEQIFLPEPEAEVSSFDRLIELLQSKSLLITFNGKTFDVPVLESRLLYHQIWLNLRSMEHLDLLHIARRLWKNKLPSCALETIEFYVLGHIRDKELDIEGSEIPQTYFQYLVNGDPELVRRIFIHNHHDILHTAALFTLICDSVGYPPAHGMDIRIDYHALAMLYKSQDKPDTAKRILLDMLSASMINKDVTRDLDLLYKKEQDWDSALDCFQIASDLDCPTAMLELCMLQENRFKQLPAALDTATKLHNYLMSRHIVDTKKVAAVELRMERIQKKIDKQHSTPAEATANKAIKEVTDV